MEDRRQVDTELYAAIGELRTGIKYVIKTVDELKNEMKEIKRDSDNKCDDCTVKKELDRHMGEHEKTKSYKTTIITFSVASGLSLVGLVLQVLKII